MATPARRDVSPTRKRLVRKLSGSIANISGLNERQNGRVVPDSQYERQDIPKAAKLEIIQEMLRVVRPYRFTVADWQKSMEKKRWGSLGYVRTQKTSTLVKWREEAIKGAADFRQLEEFKAKNNRTKTKRVKRWLSKPEEETYGKMEVLEYCIKLVRDMRVEDGLDHGQKALQDYFQRVMKSSYYYPTLKFLMTVKERRQWSSMEQNDGQNLIRSMKVSTCLQQVQLSITSVCDNLYFQ